MRSVLYILFILFLATTCGVIVGFLYWLLSSWLFDKDGFGGSRLNELIYYIVILLPPFIYCWMEYKRFKKNENKNEATIYLLA